MAALEKMFDVRGKSVIVTGGASGIGQAYAEIMAEHGAKVCIFDLNPAGLDTTVAAIRAVGGDVWGQVVNVGDRAAMAAAFDKVAGKAGS
ncbi:MAG: SDR family NAD(P)-dependent oxidoreductase, partial [Mesorhizobium sp.]